MNMTSYTQKQLLVINGSLCTHIRVIALFNLPILVHELAVTGAIVVHISVVHETPRLVAVATSHHATDEGVEGSDVGIVVNRLKDSLPQLRG